MAIEAFFEERDQRGAPRKTLRLGVEARIGADTLVATVRNLSLTGLLVETEAALAEGERLTIDLPEAGETAARVVWADAPLYGCNFESPISTAAMGAAQLRGEPAETEPAMLEDFGERLHRLRTERGMSLADIAARLGVSKPTVWAWEHGKSRPVERRLPDLAAALGVTPGGLEPAPSGPPEVLERSRRKVAEAYGVDPAQVRIMIEL